MTDALEWSCERCGEPCPFILERDDSTGQEIARLQWGCPDCDSNYCSEECWRVHDAEAH